MVTPNGVVISRLDGVVGSWVDDATVATSGVSESENRAKIGGVVWGMPATELVVTSTSDDTVLADESTLKEASGVDGASTTRDSAEGVLVASPSCNSTCKKGMDVESEASVVGISDEAVDIRERSALPGVVTISRTDSEELLCVSVDPEFVVVSKFSRELGSDTNETGLVSNSLAKGSIL